jgi:hypothetical protein
VYKVMATDIKRHLDAHESVQRITFPCYPHAAFVISDALISTRPARNNKKAHPLCTYGVRALYIFNPPELQI